MHLVSDHVAAALAAGFTLAELREGVIDDEWVAAKPKWQRFRGHPISMASVWRVISNAHDLAPLAMRPRPVRSASEPPMLPTQAAAGEWDVAITDVEAERLSQAEYFAEGTRRALALGNRGPIRFEADGRLHHEILDAYSEQGFYVFTDVVGAEELEELRADVEGVLDRAPFPRKGSPTDRHGRPALGTGMAIDPWNMAKPLSDPVGGTHKNNGRHPARMHEPAPPDGAPEEVPYLVFGCLETMDAFLRVYGHPGPAAGGRGGQRSGLHPVHRGAVRQAPGPRPLGGVAPGRPDPLGQARTGTRAPTGSTSSSSCTTARRGTASGSSPAPTGWARSTSRRWSTPTEATNGCPARSR